MNEKEKFLKQFKEYEIIENRLYKTIDKNNEIKYHYFITEPEMAQKIELLKTDTTIYDYFLFWEDIYKSENNKLTVFTYKEKIISLANKINSYYEQLKNNKSVIYENNIVIYQEKMCRNIISQLYDIIINLDRKKELMSFSLYNLNVIVIEGKNKSFIDLKSSKLLDESIGETNLKIKLNPIEYITTNYFYFTSGTSITQAPKKQLFQRTEFNKRILFEFAIIARFILTWEIRRYEIVTIPSVFSEECQDFLRKCYLNLVKFKKLKELDFLNFEKSIDNFHYKNKNLQLGESSFLSSIMMIDNNNFLDNINSKSNITLVNNGYTILKLNSFCIKPEDEDNFLNNNQIDEFLNKEEERMEEETLKYLSIQPIYSYPMSKK
jgi:hypothetical protein